MCYSEIIDEFIILALNFHCCKQLILNLTFDILNDNGMFLNNEK